MNNRKAAIIIMLFAFIVCIFFLIKDKLIMSETSVSKIFQIFDDGYTYVLDWIPGKDKLLAYHNDYIEIVDIYTGNREKILRLEGENNSYQPLAISSDAKKVILKEDENFIAFDMQTKEKMYIFRDGNATNFTWSSDNSKVAFDTGDLYVFSFINNKLIKLSTDKHYWYSIWSPKNETIAFRDYKNGTLFMIDVTNKKIKKLVDDNVYWHDWHPNGKEICYKRRGKDKNSIYLVNISNGKMRKFINLDFPSVVDISPDGKQIVLTKQTIREGIDDVITDLDIEDIDIFVMNLSSKQMINLTNTPLQMEVDPKWSSDGKKILFFQVKNIRDANPIPVFITIDG